MKRKNSPILVLSLITIYDQTYTFDITTGEIVRLGDEGTAIIFLYIFITIVIITVIRLAIVGWIRRKIRGAK